jgi:Predicted membrane protein (DUF2085)
MSTEPAQIGKRTDCVHPLTRSPAHSLRWLLVVLFLGPLAAPLFQASGLPLVADSGTLAHDFLARYICPTPAKSYALLGLPMAVCARCWGATIGLWVAWWLFRRLQIADCRLQISRRILAFFSHYLALPLGLRLALAVGALLLWRLEIDVWLAAPLPVLLINGANGGFWAAMLIGSAWRDLLISDSIGLTPHTDA